VAQDHRVPQEEPRRQVIRDEQSKRAPREFAAPVSFTPKSARWDTCSQIPSVIAHLRCGRQSEVAAFDEATGTFAFETLMAPSAPEERKTMMNRNFVDEPYTQKDADRFKELLKNYGDRPAPTFAPRERVKPGKKGNAKVAVNILRTIVKEVHGIYHDANRIGGSEFQLQELGRYVAFMSQVDMIPGPTKLHAGAFRKLGLTSIDSSQVHAKDRYESAGQLKDIVRITLCATTTEQSKNAAGTLRRLCVPANKMSLKKDEDTVADRDACGYSGSNIVVVLPCKRFGEVQVNVRSIMFGKMSKHHFCEMLAVDVAGYEQLTMRYGVEGGLGHIFYKVYSDDQTGANGLEAARLSKLYYGMLREPAADRGKAMFFKRGLDAFRQKNAAIFARH
jgi:hypothetical protein